TGKEESRQNHRRKKRRDRGGRKRDRQKRNPPPPGKGQAQTQVRPPCQAESATRAAAGGLQRVHRAFSQELLRCLPAQPRGNREGAASIERDGTDVSARAEPAPSVGYGHGNRCHMAPP